MRACYAGELDGPRLRAALSDAVVVLPVHQGRELFTADYEGIRWIIAFSGRAALASFVPDRAELAPPYWFITVRGRRLIEQFTAAITTHAGLAVGVALDVAGPRPMLFGPPLLTGVGDVALVGAGARGGER